MNNDLLGFLRSRPRAVGDAFRTNPRHESRRRALVSWKQHGREPRTIKVRLIDISRMGVALSATTPPPTSTLVCIRLVGSTPTPWIEGDVVGVEPNDGVYRVRVKFREPCPTVMLKSAVLAPQPGAPPTEAHELVASKAEEVGTEPEDEEEDPDQDQDQDQDEDES